MKKIDFIKEAQRVLLKEYNTDMCYVRIDDMIKTFESIGMLPPYNYNDPSKRTGDLCENEWEDDNPITRNE